MVVNKHGSFYMRSGWGTKIIQAIEEDDMIFTPSNEQQAIDNIGLGRIMIKALRYWAEAMQLTREEKTSSGIKLVPELVCESIRENDLYFHNQFLNKIHIYLLPISNKYRTFAPELEWWCPVTPLWLPWLRLYTLHQYR